MTYQNIEQTGKQAREAAAELASLGILEKQHILTAIAADLRRETAYILEQNDRDIQAARDNGITEVMTDRLRLTEARIESIAAAVENVRDLDDPVGEIVGGQTLPNGLKMQKKRVPLGVVGIIYESRPNVTVDAAVLCLKSSNAVILRGGKEAIHSNKALTLVMQNTLKKLGYNEHYINLVEDTSRETSRQMMRMNKYLDVLIPRGGSGLIQAVIEQATVPVIETGTGNCHTYIDSHADLDMAVRIAHNAKTQRPSVCNACESLVIHQDVAEEVLPLLEEAFASHHVIIAGCPETVRILGDHIQPATEEDYATEYLDYKISVKVVPSLEAAIRHINKYSTHHSECIVTDHVAHADQFTAGVDAAAVYVNASTRFTDGEEFGLGAEIGISTQKLHARGPMGLRELTTIKYIIQGNGQIRE